MARQPKRPPERSPAVQEALTIHCQQWPWLAVPTALVTDKRLNEPAKLTYVYLLMWSRSNGKAWPNRDKLAEARGVKRSTLYEHLRELDAAGWISKTGSATILVHRQSGIPDRSPDRRTGSPDRRTPESGQADTEVISNEVETKEEEGRPVTTSLTDRLRRVLASSSLNPSAKEFLGGLLQRVRRGECLTSEQVERLRQIEDEDAARAVGPAGASSAHRKTSQLEWYRGELDHALQVKREREEDGIPLSPGLIGKIERLKDIVQAGLLAAEVEA